jgi:AcrR family transcriptional regulator
VFGEVGYHRCSIDRVTTLAGCSRVSFYQYFSSKEDVFRHLAGQVVRQLNASAEALGPITPDAEGWATLRNWVARHQEIYERYEPVYQAFPAAAEADEAVAGGSVRAGEHTAALIRARLSGSTVPAKKLDGVIHVLQECLWRTDDTAGILRTAAADAYPRDRMADALTDVVHRTLFGLDPDVNVQAPPKRRPPTLHFGPEMLEVLADGGGGPELTAAGQRTLDALLGAGSDVLIRRGFHRTRVDDVVSAAGVSHGAFYRYFDNKEALARVLAMRAIGRVSIALTEMPDAEADLRAWLRRYREALTTEAAIIRVWTEATFEVDGLSGDSAATYDWGRRQLVGFLQPRGFGDVDREAIVMLAVLGTFGGRTAVDSVEPAALTIERGLLGR